MDYSTLDRDSGGGSKKAIRSVDASMNSLDADDYIMEDSMKKVNQDGVRISPPFTPSPLFAVDWML